LVQTLLLLLYLRLSRGILHTSCAHLSLFARRSEFGREILLSEATLILRVFSFGEEKHVVPLIAAPNVDNANRRQEKGKKLKLDYKLRVIHIKKGKVFILNYLDEVLVQSYAIGGFKKGERRDRLLIPPIFMS
jgi:hypothetical protein